LTKSEIFDIRIPIVGIEALGRRAAAERPRLFENLPDLNPTARAGKEEEFPIFFDHNPLKSPDSEK
jgi:hypothetical protein